MNRKCTKSFGRAKLNFEEIYLFYPSLFDILPPNL